MIRKTVMLKLITFSGVFDLSRFGRKSRMFFFDKNSYSKIKLSTETLMRELSHINLDETEFQHFAKTKVIAVFCLRLSQNEVFQRNHFFKYFVFRGFSGTKKARKLISKTEQINF